MAQQEARLSLSARGLLLGVALVLGLPAIAMLWTDDAKRVDWENRALAPFPHPWNKAPDAPGFFPALGDWIDDHFGLALPLSRLYRQTLFYVFKDSPSPQISIGRGGFVYLNAHNAAHPYEAFTRLCDTRAVDREYDGLAKDWIAVLRHFKREGHNVVLGIAPTKPVVYPDRLPSSVPGAIRAACLDYARTSPPALRLAQTSDSQGVEVVYPLNDFVAHREDGNFYPRQSFHFSGQSAQLFAQTLMRKVGIDPGPIDRAPRYTGEIKADLGEIFGFNRRIHSLQTDYSAFALEVRYRQPAFVESCYARALDFGTYVASAPLTDRTALILSDSFGNFTAAQLAPAYRQLTWINVTDLQEDEGPRFLSDCFARISFQDLFFVFHDGSAMWDGQRLRRVLLDGRGA